MSAETSGASRSSSNSGHRNLPGGMLASTHVASGYWIVTAGLETLLDRILGNIEDGVLHGEVALVVVLDRGEEAGRDVGSPELRPSKRQGRLQGTEHDSAVYGIALPIEGWQRSLNLAPWDSPHGTRTLLQVIGPADKAPRPLTQLNSPSPPSSESQQPQPEADPVGEKPLELGSNTFLFLGETSTPLLDQHYGTPPPLPAL
ncbi:hypothetical protein GGTG_08774 [Gaeumannomyces tritici R3-111a-1]|uniref:Uncharacterized protein n=1 Tax=Gaeumannomyces tritici (strain R3-111a-1) TaxID=644352 RepID=J3P5I5_GAET3|nr:hypothetical protein GGTG_08774 [Gaeumannomyces tritici R3-111a-1]EJT74936.1 hypothetical protein GGTG_08774 [Gaeumannomyces tritici R3-111a-1]